MFQALVLGVFAQVPPPPVQPIALARERPAHPQVVTPRDGTIWVRGADYKAHFVPGRVEFTPFLGSRAPRNFPVAFELAAVRIGGVDVEFARDALPEAARGSVRFDRGSVEESYTLGVRSIEQRFVLAEPRARGAIDVSISVASALAFQGAAAGLAFGNDLGGVRYGLATAIDARGWTLRLDTTWDGEAISIHVPAEFAGACAYPLTIDPVISAFGIHTSSTLEERHPDVAFDANAQRYLVVAEVGFSTGDTDVVSRYLDVNGVAEAGSDLFIDVTDDSWTSPSVANIGYQTDFAVVAVVGPPETTGTSIRAVVRNGNTLTPVLDLSGAETGIKRKPDVAGCDQTSNLRFAAAWERESSAAESDIHARLFTPAASAVSATVLLANSDNDDDRAPAISVGSFSAEWTIVWQRTVTPTNHDLYYARLQNDATVTVAPTALETSAADDTNVAISDRASSNTGGVHSMVAFERRNGAQRDVMAAEFTYFGILEGLANVSALDASTAARDQHTPRVECDGNRFLLAWHEVLPSGDAALFAAEFHGVLLTSVLDVAREPVSALSGVSADVRLASRSLEIGANPGFLVAWGQTAPSATSDVHGAIYVPRVGLPVRTICFGDGTGTACPCGNSGNSGNGCASSVVAGGANLASTGIAATLADSLVLQGSNMPPNTACLYFQGTLVPTTAGSAGAVFGDGLRCASGTVIRLGTKFNSAAGASAYPTGVDQSVSIRGAINVQGSKRYYQAWYRNAASFCTTSTFNLSNALEVNWTPL